MSAASSVASSFETLGTALVPGQHIAQSYRNDEHLVEALAVYVRGGLCNSERIVLVATNAHIAQLQRILPISASHEDVLTFPAEEILLRILPKGKLDSTAFYSLANELLDRSDGRPTRVFGELVNLLWLSGDLTSAMALEELWENLARSRPFALFCGYQMDNLDLQTCAGPLREVCDTHSTLITADDGPQLERALQSACSSTVDPLLEGRMRNLAARPREARAKMPSAQAALLWLSHNMPATALPIFEKVRYSCLR